MNVDWIRVNNGGKFIAGSTSCKINKKVIITFHGDRSLANSIGTDPADFGMNSIITLFHLSFITFNYFKTLIVINYVSFYDCYSFFFIIIIVAPFGTKGMAVATGATLELHGHNSGPSWTRLAATAKAGSTSILLEDSVTWKAGNIFSLSPLSFTHYLTLSLSTPLIIILF